MRNYRVIMTGNSGDGFIYTIEDVCQSSLPQHAVSLFVQHYPSTLSASSVSGLKEVLRQMLRACDKPVLALRPEHLVELSIPKRKA